MLNKSLTLLLSSVILFSTSISAKEYSHSLGTINIDTIPKRVVILSYGALDFADTLGIDPVGVPQSGLPDYLTEYTGKQYTNTGTLKEVDYETLYTLKPDLIIADGRQVKNLKMLNQIAPTYPFFIDNTNYWQSTKQHWQTLGEIFDKDAEVAKLTARMETQITEQQAKLKNQPLEALTVINIGNKVANYGKNSRFSFVYENIGFNSIHSTEKETGSHGNIVSFEYLADAKPDVLFVLDREQAIGENQGRAKALFDNPLVESTPAAQNNKIVFLDGQAWYLAAGGYKATQTMLNDLSSAL